VFIRRFRALCIEGFEQVRAHFFRAFDLLKGRGALQEMHVAPEPTRAIRNFIGSCRRARFGLKIPRDQAGAFVERKIRPRPLEKHCEAVAKPDQKNNVHEQPDEPRRKAAQMYDI
jgi:hypothetical protein